MSRPHRLLIVSLCLAIAPIATNALAGSPANTHPRLSPGNDLVVGGRPTGADKVVVDTLLVMGPWGSGAPYNGQFQTPAGAPAWNGWTSDDLTQSDISHWHVDTYHAVSGTYSAWCGDLVYPSCHETDPDVGGYGNNWVETLEWRGTVANPDLPCTLTIGAMIDLDTEPGYDFAYLSLIQGGAITNLWSMSGVAAAMPLNFQAIYLPTDYRGLNNNEVVIRFRFISDGTFSDEDCLWPTAGAFRVDDVQINLSNGNGYSHDFEDGTLGEFQIAYENGVGDFAKIWTGLQTAPGSVPANNSPMVAFVDDGVVVPGTGGTACLSWCYGPGGYIVNNSGGGLSQSAHLDNVIESPPMAWPDPTYDGADFSFDVWRHEGLAAVSPGIFFRWNVRSTANADPAALDSAPWVSRNLLYDGGPDWLRLVQPVGDLVVTGARWVQLQLGVVELGWAFGLNGSDGTPAPYFDNVRLTAYPAYGPLISAVQNDLPHDAFPEHGTVDLTNLGTNHVRFDMGQRGAPNDANFDLTTIPGDSTVVSFSPQRAGAVLSGAPRLNWRLRPNPFFDTYRSSGLGTSGFTEGWLVPNQGTPAVKYAFDLPDSGFLFPGDLLHYYFEGSDVVGDEIQTLTLPADTTGFANFDDPLAYGEIFTLRALPSLRSDPPAPNGVSQPTILFWDDGGSVGNPQEWYTSFANLGLTPGQDFDIYHTNHPYMATAQGLGGRSTAAQLAGYDDLLYSCGVISFNSLNMGLRGSFGPTGNDIAVVTAWLQQGDKDLLLMGDNLAGDLFRSGSDKALFLTDWMGVDLVEDDVLPFLDGQTSPLVGPVPGNPVFVNTDQWLGVGLATTQPTPFINDGSSVTGPRQYDGVSTRPGAQCLAEFLSPAGAAGTYGFSAATLNVRADFNARIISLPYDFQSIWTPTAGGNKADAPLAARTLVLQDILTYFDQTAGGSPSPVLPAAELFAAHAYPNPFNPKVTIVYNLPLAGRLTVKLFDVRGRLVQTVADLRREAGAGQVQWDGRTSSGEAAAAGVYFYKVSTGYKDIIGKIALIK